MSDEGVVSTGEGVVPTGDSVPSHLYGCSFEGCDYAHQNRNTLKMHKKKHTVCHPCAFPGCDYVAPIRSNVIRHEKKRHGSSPTETKRDAARR